MQLHRKTSLFRLSLVLGTKSCSKKDAFGVVASQTEDVIRIAMLSVRPTVDTAWLGTTPTGNDNSQRTWPCERKKISLFVYVQKLVITNSNVASRAEY